MSGARWWRVLRCAPALLALGCGITSTYQRENAPDQELQWSVRKGQLTVIKGSLEVGHEKGWYALPEAVVCVDQAHAFAESAANRNLWGEVLVWTAWGSFALGGLAGAAVGLAMGTLPALANPAIFTDPSAIASNASLLIWGGSFLLGLVAASVGTILVDSSLPLAMDAVNVYNDSYQAQPACQQ